MEPDATKEYLQQSPNAEILQQLVDGKLEGALEQVRRRDRKKENEHKAAFLVLDRLVTVCAKDPGKTDASGTFFSRILSLLKGRPKNPFAHRFKDLTENSSLLAELTRLALALQAGRLLATERLLAATAARQLAVELATQVGGAAGDYPATSIRGDVFSVGADLRGLAGTLALFFQEENWPGEEGQMWFVRAKATNTVLGHYPHLVGEAMLDVAKYHERRNQPTEACRFFDPYILDTERLLEEYGEGSEPPPEEDLYALQMLKEACAGYLRCGCQGRSRDVAAKLAKAEQILLRVGNQDRNAP